MALTEEQIIRFSRQILLREVGGAGQEKLLAAHARTIGRGAAVWTAAAYVVAGGSALSTNGALPASVDELGFLVGAAGLADTEAQGQVTTSIVAPSASAPEEGAVAIICASHLVFGTASTCRACLTQARGDASVRPKSEDAYLLGALAALVHQRNALGQGDAGVIRLREDGGLERAPLTPCERCR